MSSKTLLTALILGGLVLGVIVGQLLHDPTYCSVTLVLTSCLGQLWPSRPRLGAPIRVRSAG